MQFMTPLLASKLAGQYVAVDPMGLFVSTSQVLPVSVKPLNPLVLAKVDIYLNAGCPSACSFGCST
jgi:hypothetical protein